MARYNLTRSWSDPYMQKLAEWVAATMPGAEAPAAELIISPEAIVAQAALESSWGRAAIGHNIFGIKASADWHGPTLLQRTAEQRADGSVYYIDALFRDYPTFGDCMVDWLAFLKRNTRYAAAGVFVAHTDRGFFEALKRGGYATDIAYPEKLMKMVDSVRLFTAAMMRSETADAVAQAKPPGRLLLIGMHDDKDVEHVQSALEARGLYAGDIDGDFGPFTYDAVVAFQKANPACGDVDGIVGDKTRAALGL